MSQPWSVFGGHIVSALAGVASQQWLGHDPMLAASMAVGLAIALMYPLRCLHPPGGATAITAVVGGGSVHALGYGFVVMPIMINTVIILLRQRPTISRFPGGVIRRRGGAWQWYPSLRRTLPVQTKNA